MILSSSPTIDLSLIPKVSDCFHLETLISDDVFLTEDGSIGSAFSVEGVDETLFSQSATDSAHAIWQRAIQSLGDRCVVQVVQHQQPCVSLGEDAFFGQDVASNFRKEFEELLLKRGLYEKKTYLFLWYRCKKTVRRKKLFLIGGHSKHRKKSSRMLADFYEIRKQFECQMVPFKCRLLSALRQAKEMLNATSVAVNGGFLPAENIDNEQSLSQYPQLSSLLAKHHIAMSDCVKFSLGGKKHYASVLSLNHYPAATSLSHADVLSRLPIKSIKVDTFIPVSKSDSFSRLNRTLSKYETSEDKALDHVAAIKSAMTALAQDELSLGLHQQSLMLVSPDRSELSALVNQIKAEYLNRGASVIEESVGLPLAFWSLCPGGFRYLSRLVPITSKNFSDLCSLHRKPCGHQGYSEIGGASKPLAWLRTRHNTGYRFNCHEKGGDRSVPLGHTLIVGSSGSGKTVFLAWLSAQLQQYQGRLFYFDRDHSAYSYFKAMNATCLLVHPRGEYHLNPFSLPDSVSHRLFLQFWMTTLCDDVSLTPKDKQLIKFSVDYVYDEVERRNRCLSAAVSVLPIDFSGWDALSQWLDESGDREEGKYATLLSSQEDSLQWQDIVYMDISFLLSVEDPSVMRVILTYIFYRLEEGMGQGLTSILLDEAWAYLRDPFWSRYFNTWLPTLRKKHAHVVMATQSVQHVTQSDACSSLLDNIATMVYFKQPMASREDYQHQLHLSDKEFEVVKHDLHSRELLVKQGSDSVIVELDVSELPYFLSLLQGDLS